MSRDLTNEVVVLLWQQTNETTPISFDLIVDNNIVLNGRKYDGQSGCVDRGLINEHNELDSIISRTDILCESLQLHS